MSEVGQETVQQRKNGSYRISESGSANIYGGADMCDYNNLFKKIAKLRTKEAELKAEREALEKEIKDFMTAEGMSELLGKEHRACYIEVTSNKFDTTAFKRDHAEMAQLYTKPSTSMRFTFN